MLSKYITDESEPLWRRCPDSVWTGLAISLIVGVLFTSILMGPAPLNPHNISWLTGDPAMYYTAWELFRQDPHWHWPLTYTTRVGYPLGENIALMDPNPLFAVLLKPFSSVLPEPFQYFGIEVVLSYALLFFFSMKLFRLILGPNLPAILLCSLFFCIAPPLLWNTTRHFAVSNHWLLLAALLLYVQTQQQEPGTIRRFVIAGLVLTAVAVAVNPYLLFEVVLVLMAATGSLLWQRRLSLVQAFGFLTALGAVGATVAASLGYFISGGRGYSQWGYRFYSLNLLAPFDPYAYGSILSHLLHYFPHESPTYSGTSYLGAGIIFLAIFLFVVFALQPRKRPSLNARQVVPLLLCCVLLTFMAISTKVMIGSATLVDFDTLQRLTPLLSVLRISVYLFWIPYYTILIAVLAAPFFLFRRFLATSMLAIVFLVQVVDVAPLMAWARAKVDPNQPDTFWKTTELQPLHSPVWFTLGSFHQNLVVLPAWQCSNSTPGGMDGYRIFGLLATAQDMRTNSYRSGRYTEVNHDFHCRQAIAELATQPLSPDTAYVVTPALAEVIAQGPTGPGKCHKVDGFVLCSSKLDFAQVASGGKAIVADQ